MTNLSQKIKELEAKHKEYLKAEKAKLVAKHRATEKKEQEAKNKQFLTKLMQFRKQISNDDILLGGLVRTLELVQSGEQAKINQLIDLSKTLAD